jgi:hypothetical protein
MKLFGFTNKHKKNTNKTNKNKKETNRDKMNKVGFYGPRANVTNQHFQQKLSFQDVLHFLNPNSIALYQTAKVNFKTTLKAKAAVAGLDAAALAVKFLTSVDITQFRVALEFFKNKKTGISDSFYVLIESCLTDLQVVLDYDKLKRVVAGYVNAPTDKTKLVFEIKHEFATYPAIVIAQFVDQFLIFLETMKAYTFFLANYDSVYQQIKKDFQFGLEEVINVFKEQLILMQMQCNRVMICLDQYDHDYKQYKLHCGVSKKMDDYLKALEAGEKAAMAFAKTDEKAVKEIENAIEKAMEGNEIKTIRLDKPTKIVFAQ